MVDTGHFVADEIRHVSAMLLGIHVDDRVRFQHVGAQFFIGGHLNLECIQHFGGAQFVNPPVIA